MDGQGEGRPTVDRPEAESGRVDAIITVGWARILYIGVAVVAAALLVIDISHPSDWTVDNTALGLLGVLLVIPLIEQLRKLKFGNLEVELREIQRRVKQVDERVQREVAAVATDNPDELATDTRGSIPPSTKAAPTHSPVLQPLSRIVWVDDDPRNNAALVSELSERYEVQTATTTEQGLRLVDRAPELTLVVSDSVRIENGQPNHHAGEQLARTLREKYPFIPIFIFAGYHTVRDHRERLGNAGADLVTSSAVELGRAIRNTTAQRLKDAVRAVASKAGQVDEGLYGLDFVVQAPSGPIGLEVKDWRRTPKREALDAVWGRFNELLREKGSSAYLVLPSDVLLDAQRERAPQGAEAVTLSELESRLLPKAEAGAANHPGDH
jgi:CheY-like chemotaxis protein